MSKSYERRLMSMAGLCFCGRDEEHSCVISRLTAERDEARAEAGELEKANREYGKLWREMKDDYLVEKARAERAKALFEAMRRDVILMQEACNRFRSENAAARREAFVQGAAWGLNRWSTTLGEQFDPHGKTFENEALRRWPEVK